MKLARNAFANGAKFDAKFTVEGEDIYPALSWSGSPPGTKKFALVCDDPDAPSPRRPVADPWVHCVIFNIPFEKSDLPAGIERKPEPAQIADKRQGKNSWPCENIGYRGPAPPGDSGPHRYFFKLYTFGRRTRSRYWCDDV